MPASEVMKDFAAHTLHSGKGGPIVTNPKQAVAIKYSYLRKEGQNTVKKAKKSMEMEKAMKGGKKHEGKKMSKKMGK